MIPTTRSYFGKRRLIPSCNAMIPALTSLVTFFQEANRAQVAIVRAVELARGTYLSSRIFIISCLKFSATKSSMTGMSFMPISDFMVVIIW